MPISKENALREANELLVGRLQDFERQVDAAITQRSAAGGKVITVAIASVPRPVLETAMDHYRKVGWSVRIVNDQRDGDYLELS